MTQAIDPVKLKAAAEHLEWVLQQYPNNSDVQGLLQSLTPLIEDAKAGRVLVPVDKVPCAYNFADGMYVPYDKPSIEDAYYEFAAQLRGGRDEQELRIIAAVEADRRAKNATGERS